MRERERERERVCKERGEFESIPPSLLRKRGLSPLSLTSESGSYRILNETLSSLVDLQREFLKLIGLFCKRSLYKETIFCIKRPLSYEREWILKDLMRVSHKREVS